MRKLFKFIVPVFVLFWIFIGINEANRPGYTWNLFLGADVFLNTFLGGEKETISDRLGREVLEESNPFATAFCTLLLDRVFEEDGHCQNAYLNGE